MKMHDALPPALICALLFLSSCQQYPDPAAMRQSAGDEIMKADIAWSEAAKDFETHVAAFLDDAVVLAPGEEMISGKTAIEATLGAFYDDPGFSVSWKPMKSEGSGSGDLGYSYGTYHMTMTGPDGVMHDEGKYATVWKKQADGSWKVAVDMFNSSAPSH
ncbi:MAG: DUF4440 domain-containing protein [Ignavibacteria bacterium]|nr:DUF4440 domain-containing protein [Ignavibacteria bacterium]